MYTIRDARPDDLPGLERVDALVEGHSHGDILGRAIAEGKVAVAEGEDGVAGYLRWEHFWDTIPYCTTARVAPEHQRRGLGRRLFEHVERGFRAAGATFWLSSTEETNERSRLFHAALGFREIGRLSELDQEMAEIFYRKDL